MQEAVNGSALHERFSITDAQTNVQTPIRELSEEQLANYSQSLFAQAEAARKQVVAALANLEQISRGLGAIDYETDRRARSLVVATRFPARL